MLDSPGLRHLFSFIGIITLGVFLGWSASKTHQIGIFLLSLHSQGLGHEAAIEIMISLLGLILTVFAGLLAIFGFFGYSAIKDESVRKATAIARDVASRAAQETFREYSFEARAADYTESQKEQQPVISVKAAAANMVPSTPIKRTPGKKKATKDANLKRGEEL